jgi:hypothetical protein
MTRSVSMASVDEIPSVYSGHYEVGVVIDRPVAEVWQQFLDIGSWVTSHDIEDVEGTPQTLGSITRVSFRGVLEAGYPPAHYHYCKIITLDPERDYVLKTYSEQGGSYGLEISAFDHASFAEVDGKTTVTFDLFAEYKTDAAEIDRAAMDEMMKVSSDGMVKNLGKLKALVESG